MGRIPVPKWGLLREGSNQQGIEDDMDPKTEETKLKVEVETKRKVEGRKNLRQTQSDPGEKSPSRALTPTKRDSQSARSKSDYRLLRLRDPMAKVNDIYVLELYHTRRHRDPMPG